MLQAACQLVAHWLLCCCLSQVLFTPATQAARQAACTIVEALTTIPSRKQQVLDLLTRYEAQEYSRCLLNYQTFSITFLGQFQFHIL